jgi:hypothetical protein
VWGHISLWFYFASLWSQMLSIFSCIYWSFVYLLRNIYSNPSSIFKQVYSFSWLYILFHCSMYPLMLALCFITIALWYILKSGSMFAWLFRNFCGSIQILEFFFYFCEEWRWKFSRELNKFVCKQVWEVVILAILICPIHEYCISSIDLYSVLVFSRQILQMGEL